MSITLAIDTMSGDYGPAVVMPAVCQALADYPHLNVILVGQQACLLPYCQVLANNLQARLQIVAADEIVAADSSLRQVLRQGTGSSMAKMLQLLAIPSISAAVTAGNTAALLGLAHRLVGKMPGIKRPALMTLLPNNTGKQTVLLDIGANLSVNGEQLCQLARLGSAFAQLALKIEQPQVALLNIASEQHKGALAVQQAARSLQQQHQLAYLGFIESNQIFTSTADVIVCDGGSGNLLLKTIEGMASLVSQTVLPLLSVKQQQQFTQQAAWLDPRQYNGACLVGFEQLIVKSHGAADTMAFYSAIKRAMLFAEQQLPMAISQRLMA